MGMVDSRRQPVGRYAMHACTSSDVNTKEHLREHASSSYLSSMMFVR
jgi:hypothetical protein